MDNAAIGALVETYDLDIVYETWLESVIKYSLSEELTISQLTYIEELTGSYAFYGIIEEMLKPYQEQYPLVYARAWSFINYDDDDSMG